MLAALASLALQLLPVLPEAPVASPALYSVRDADTTIYIFGTFHVLDPSIRWFEGDVETAFHSADELVVETLPPSIATAQNRQARATWRTQMPAASFLATSQAAVTAGKGQGMSLENGADMVLLRSAAAWGKDIEPLETLQSQFAMLAKLPAVEKSPDAAPALPVLAPADVSQQLGDTMAKLQAAWAAGDQGVFAAMVSDMRLKSPDAYRVMFVERNARWTDWIAARMREPGTVFVAVGAGHLSGPDSLLVRLAERGHISRRVDTRD